MVVVWFLFFFCIDEKLSFARICCQQQFVERKSELAKIPVGASLIFIHCGLQLPQLNSGRFWNDVFSVTVTEKHCWGNILEERRFSPPGKFETHQGAPELLLMLFIKKLDVSVPFLLYVVTSAFYKPSIRPHWQTTSLKLEKTSL